MADNNNNGNNKIFRQKSLDKVSSVEDLDKYIKTTTPSLWLLLASIIVLLVGVIVWATVGKINVESTVGCDVNNGVVSCYVSEEKYESIMDNSYIEIDDQKINIKKINGPIKESNDSAVSLLHISGIEDGAWYYIVTGNCNLKNGTYKGKIVFEEISPIVYIIN